MPDFLAVVDTFTTALRTSGVEPKLTYNRHHIAIATTGYNFCWFYPRKLAFNCHVEFRVNSDLREAAVAVLQAGGIDASPYRKEMIAFSLTAKAVDAHAPLLVEALKQAEEWSKR